MALRDQPYLPLYVQDFLTDEKLNECSAESTGVYIRIMCIMHKSDPYGTICLNDKYKQISGNHAGNGGSKTSGDIKGFAAKLFRQMPYELATIENAITELVSEGVMQIEGDYLMQKRMVKDGRLSLVRAESGRKGGEAKSKAGVAKGFANALANEFATAKSVASTESEYESENEDEDDVLKEGVQGGEKPAKKESKHKHGEYKNVLLTDTDLEKLQAEHPGDWRERIEALSSYMESTGRKYKNHFVTMQRWAQNDKASTPIQREYRAPEEVNW